MKRKTVIFFLSVFLSGFSVAGTLKEDTARAGKADPMAGSECDAPVMLYASGVTQNSVRFSCICVSSTHKVLRLNVGGSTVGTYLWNEELFYDVDGLLPETTYEARVRAVCAEGDSSRWTDPVSFTTEKAPCEAPAYFGTSEITDSSAKFVCMSPSGTRKILRLNREGKETGTYVWEGAEPYEVTGLQANTAYDACLRTVCGEGDSSRWTDPVAFTTKFGFCEPPTWLGTDSITSNSVRFLCMSSSDRKVLRVLREERIIGYYDWNTPEPYKVSGLLPETTYEAQVRAVCIEGDSSQWTEPVEFTTTAGPCQPPIALMPAGITDTSVRFLCLSLSGTHKILRLREGGKVLDTYDWNSILDYEVKGLRPETVYEAEVRTVCAEGDSSQWLPSVEFTTLAEGEMQTDSCAPPVMLVPTNITAHSADFVSLSLSGIHKVLRLTHEGRVFGTYDWNSLLEYQVSGLEAGTTYEAEVRTVCAGGDSSQWLSPVEFTTLEEGDPGGDTCAAPISLLVSNVTSTSAHFTCVSIAGLHKVLRITRAGKTVEEYDWNSLLGLEVEGLQPNTSYEAYVRTVCAEGDSSRWLDPVAFTTGICGLPTELNSSVSGTSVSLRWTAGENNVSFVVSYRKANQDESGTLRSVLSTARLSDLEENVAYIWTVRGICEGDSSGYAPDQVFTTESAANGTTGEAVLRVVGQRQVIHVLNPSGIRIDRIEVYGTDGRLVTGAQVGSAGNVSVSVKGNCLYVVRVLSEKGCQTDKVLVR